MTENELKTLLKTVTPPNKAARAAAHAHWAALAKPLSIIFASSKNGATFEGAPGSTLLVDDVELIFE